MRILEGLNLIVKVTLALFGHGILTVLVWKIQNYFWYSNQIGLFEFEKVLLGGDHETVYWEDVVDIIFLINPWTIK